MSQSTHNSAPKAPNYTRRRVTAAVLASVALAVPTLKGLQYGYDALTERAATHQIDVKDLTPDEVKTVVVRPGQSAFEIADHYTDGDPRPLTHVIQEQGANPNGGLNQNQQVLIPKEMISPEELIADQPDQ